MAVNGTGLDDKLKADHVVNVPPEESAAENPKNSAASDTSGNLPLPSSGAAGSGLSISGLATYMPTGTISAFVVLTQLVADGGQCKHTTDAAGNFVKAHDKAEVSLMVLVIWLLGVVCFVSAFVKTKKDPRNPGHVTYKFITSPNELLGRGKESQHDDGTLKWSAGWKLWVHAIFSTLAYVTWSLTSTSATSCFYSLPNAVSRSLSPIVSVICAIAFNFLGPPTIEDETELTSIPDAEKLKKITGAFRTAEILLNEHLFKKQDDALDKAKTEARAEDLKRK